jgi:very-short-patch-repair endonuclease
VRQIRRETTDMERKLWCRLRARQLGLAIVWNKHGRTLIIAS